MRRTRAAGFVLFAAPFVSVPALAAGGAPQAPAAAESGAVGDSEQEPSWAFSALGYVYFVPEDSNYVQPSLAADHDVLHLEARYNYEDRVTGSLWAGYTFSGGDELGWEIAPMLGGVFGRTNGVAPGYRGSLSYWKLELYSEGEYLFDFGQASASFFFNWSELTIAPVDWFRFGLVTQRTRAYASERDIQRGALAGVSYRIASLTAYLLNPDDSEPILIIGASLTFD